MVRLPDFDHDDLIIEDGWICRVLYDAEGNEVYRIKGGSIRQGSGIDINQQDDRTAYQREYYRKVRSKRDGRTPRGPYRNKN